MQRDLIVKGRSLGASSDLTLFAPIKAGFIDSLESVTYKTRVKRVLDSLHTARSASHEYGFAKLLSDAVERVGAIHSVRVAVLEPEDKVMLVVTFDGNWDAYVRVLWDKVGSLLDLIFCSTQDYVTSHDHSFEQWQAWAKRVQIETGFFYGPPNFSSRDVLYHRRLERMRERGLGTELNELRAVLPSAESLVSNPSWDNPDDPPPPPDLLAQLFRGRYESIQHGLQALAGLYRLTEYFRPGTDDGIVLRLAGIQLLLEFITEIQAIAPDQTAIGKIRVRFARQMDWLFPGTDDTAKYDIVIKRPRPALDPINTLIEQEVQGGILESYADITHGAIVLIAFDNTRGAAEFLSTLQPQVLNAAKQSSIKPGTVIRNISFTLAGLRACGLSEDELEQFPEDFRQGMAARAGVLGDVRNNHPRRWRLPKRFESIQKPESDLSVEISATHAVVHLRVQTLDAKALVTTELSEANHPLHAEVKRLAGMKGLRILAVQSLKRKYRNDKGKQSIVDHFGYADGASEPAIGAGPADFNRINLGEVLVGHSNAADFANASLDAVQRGLDAAKLKWQLNGSFLVLRKYRQFTERLERVVDEAATQLAQHTKQKKPDAKELVYGKLLGRMRNGDPLIASSDTGLNAFNYERDPHGEKCPLHAHIRLANPRIEAGEGMARPPRIIRRSMSYGPDYASKPSAERGLVFMAYNASLSEQFEVVQRWLTGGNVTGSSSGHSCPIVGVPENGYTRHFKFEYKGTSAGVPGEASVQSVGMERQTPAFEEPDTATRLEWGLYTFSPAMSVLEKLQVSARRNAVGGACPMNIPWDKVKGRALLAKLQRIEKEQSAEQAMDAWKSVIEDPEAIDRFDSAAMWAAIREDHGGVLRTPYGVLVAGRELVAKVYADNDTYSVRGQRERMIKSIGDISLGKDDGKDDNAEYQTESKPINEAILGLSAQHTYEVTFEAAAKKLKAIIESSAAQAKGNEITHFSVSFEARELLDEALADLCEYWFGISDGEFFKRGSADWHWKEDQPPLYPGHFTALSRYMFQPNPGQVPIELAQRYGRALTASMERFIKPYVDAKKPPEHDGQPAKIAEAAFKLLDTGGDYKLIARTMIGVMMGFTPTIIGAVLNVLREWQRDGNFWLLRNQAASKPIRNLAEAYAALHGPLQTATKVRPMPQIGWRIARKAHRIGIAGGQFVDVHDGEKVVLAMVSATQQSLEDGIDDGRVMFGGVREDPNNPTKEAAIHPTHACPGYHAGIAAMLGTLAALISCKEALRPGLAPLSFEVRGESGYVPPVATQKFMTLAGSTFLQNAGASTTAGLFSKSPAYFYNRVTSGFKDEWLSHIRPDGTPLAKPPVNLSTAERKELVIPSSNSKSGLVLVWGDSWVAIPKFSDLLYLDIRDKLASWGYTAPTDFTGSVGKWAYLRTMAQPANIQAFQRFVKEQFNQSQKPRAIVLSGGGNDSVSARLGPGGANLPEGPDDLVTRKNNKGIVINEANLTKHLEDKAVGLRFYLEQIVLALKVVVPKSAGKFAAPIIVHGYDHPIPFKTAYPDWIRKPFYYKGYVNQAAPQDDEQVDFPVVRKAMAYLIDELNKRVFQKVANDHPDIVRYVNLTDTIRSNSPNNPVAGWHDNMHPSVYPFGGGDGFELVAAQIVLAIEKGLK